MLRDPGSPPTVLVTDARLGSALSIIRSLGRRGWRVIAADSSPRSPGFRSRYAAERLLCPCPEAAPHAAVDALLRHVQEAPVDLLIPVTDAVILPLSRMRDRFEGLCRLALPEAGALEAVTSKRKTVEVAARLGIPVPRTVVARSVEEALDLGPDLGWPLVLKPDVSRLYSEGEAIERFTVSYAADRDDLAEQMRRVGGRCPVLLQEYHPGAGFGVELLLHEGTPLAAFQHQRLREVPITGGASAFRQSVPLDPGLYDHSVRLLRELRWTGLAMVEFRVGADGPRLMEINGRVWGSLPLAVRSGMDFPGRLADLLPFGPPPAGTACAASYRHGVRARNLGLDLVWIASVLLQRRKYPFLPAPRRLESLGALLQLLHPGCASDNVAWDDLGPALADLPEIAALFAGKLGDERGRNPHARSGIHPADPHLEPRESPGLGSL